MAAASAGIFIMAQGAAQMVAQGPALLARLDEIAVEHRPVAAPSRAAPHQRDRRQGQRCRGRRVRALGNAGAVIRAAADGGLFRLHACRAETDRGEGRECRRVIGPGKRDQGNDRSASPATSRPTSGCRRSPASILTHAAAAVMLAVGLDNVLFWAVIFFLLTFIPEHRRDGRLDRAKPFCADPVPDRLAGDHDFPRHPGRRDHRRQSHLPAPSGADPEYRPGCDVLSLAFWSWLWGLPGAFLAVPMTLMSMMVFAQFESTGWVAAMLSNDGNPLFHRARGPGTKPSSE